MTSPDFVSNLSGKENSIIHEAGKEAVTTLKPPKTDGALIERDTTLEMQVIAYGSDAYAEALDLRRCVLRDPLGLEFAQEELLRDELDTHVGCRIGGVLVGCLILSPLDDIRWKVRQVAVISILQRCGIGSRLMVYAETIVLLAGGSVIEMHARESAVGFYRRLGYDTEGDYFVEVTLPHIVMKKTLDAEKCPTQ